MRTPAGGGGSNQRTWSMQGNIVTDDDFIGTLENYKPLKFKVDGNAFGQFHPGGGITLGFGAEAFTDDAIAIGRNAKALTSSSIAIGKDASVSVTNSSIAFGENAKVSAHRALAFGFNSEASNLSSLALGAESTASGQASTALGRETNASAQYSTAIGYGATVSQANTIRLGNNDASVGIGTSTPNQSTILDISSSNKGILIPRVSLSSNTAQDIIHSPVVSLLVYNTNTVTGVTPGFYFWTGSAWQALGGNSSGGGSSTKSYGERYYNVDTTVTLPGSWGGAAPLGIFNTITNLSLIDNNGLQTGATGGVYKVTLTVTYSKVQGDINEIEFYLTKNTNLIENTTIRGELTNQRKTLTLVKILTLAPWTSYHFGIKSSSSNPTTSVNLHANSTNIILEKID